MSDNLDPASEDVSFGLLLSEQGASEEALVELLPFAAMSDRDVQFHLGRSFGALGSWPEASVHYERAAQLAPGDADVLAGLGEALYACDRKAEAQTALRAARALNPGDAHVNHLLGLALLDTVHEEEALDCLRDAFEANTDPRAANNYAIILSQLGRQQRAIEVLRQTVEHHPDYARAWDTLGALYVGLGQRSKARAAFEQAIALNPEEPQPYINLANALDPKLNSDSIAECLRQALERCRDDVDLLTEIVRQYRRLDDCETAIAILRRLLDLEPSHQQASSKFLHISLECCDWQDYDGLVADTLARVDADLAGDAPLSYVLFNLFALPVSNELLLRAARHQARCIAERAGAGVLAPFVHRTRHHARIRIGYALPYTRFFSMPLVMCDLVENHDRDRFEVHGYTIDRPQDDAFSQRFCAAFDSIKEVPECSPQTAARAIHDDEIDILIDVTGHTPASCLPILALRPAPVQVHAVGYSLTCGADYVDYLVSDPTFIPEDWAAQCHEALAYLPDIFMPSFPRPESGVAVDRSRYELPEKVVVFANFNDAYKFDPVMFACWMRILARAPDSVLWFGSWTKLATRNLRHAAAAHGIEPERLLFAPVVRHDEHAARLELADIALDNQYHGGGVTGTDALSAGLPLVTVRGATPAARLGATLCAAAGVPELVTDSLAAYEELAVTLARDAGRRRGLRQRLNEARHSSPLFDRARYRRHLEAAYEIMWQRHRDGVAPQTFHVPALP